MTINTQDLAFARYNNAIRLAFADYATVPVEFKDLEDGLVWMKQLNTPTNSNFTGRGYFEIRVGYHVKRVVIYSDESLNLSLLSHLIQDYFIDPVRRPGISTGEQYGKSRVFMTWCREYAPHQMSSPPQAVQQIPPCDQA